MFINLIRGAKMCKTLREPERAKERETDGYIKRGRKKEREREKES